MNGTGDQESTRRGCTMSGQSNIVPIGPLPDAFGIVKPISGIEWATAPNGAGFWLVSDYKLARQILADRRFCRNDAAGREAAYIGSYKSAPNAIISLEGAEHARIRRLVAA